LIAGLAAPSAGMIDWPQSTYDAEWIPQQSLGFVFEELTPLPWRTIAGNRPSAADAFGRRRRATMI